MKKEKRKYRVMQTGITKFIVQYWGGGQGPSGGEMGWITGDASIPGSTPEEAKALFRTAWSLPKVIEEWEE